MEMAVLIGVLVAAGLLMVSGVWVGVVLITAVIRIKRPAVTTARGVADDRAVTPHPDSGQL
jgi:hypothetical protein